MANLDIIEREGLLDRGRELEGELDSALRTLEGAPLVGEIRAGMGVLGAVAFSGEALAEAPDLPQRSSRPRATAGSSSARWATAWRSRRRSSSPATRSTARPRRSATRWRPWRATCPH